jgi:heptaprenyl diphosphate synthase
MPWPDRLDDTHIWKKRPAKLVFLSLMTALAMVLQILESVLPNPAPWVRLGLANIVILIVLSLFGIKEGLMVTGLRVVLAATLLGTIFGPTFWLSLSGGLSSTLAMGLFMDFFPGKFSIIGISVIGAYTHNLVQLIVASWFIIRQPSLIYLLPILLVTALIAGFVTGIAASILMNKLERHWSYL